MKGPIVLNPVRIVMGIMLATTAYVAVTQYQLDKLDREFKAKVATARGPILDGTILRNMQKTSDQIREHDALFDSVLDQLQQDQTKDDL